jgi:putative sigma-54 modulation protein
MEITIESPHFKASSELIDYVNGKAGKLVQINERLILCEVFLKLDKSSTDTNKVCEMKVLGPQIEIFASEQSTTFEEAVTETIHALEKQLRKQKTKNEKGREKLQVEDTAAEESVD